MEQKINNYLEQKLGKILNKKFAMLFILLISAMWVISLIVKGQFTEGILDPIALIILTILFILIVCPAIIVAFFALVGISFMKKK